MTRTAATVLGVTLTLGGAAIATAQNELVTDRPDQTESAVTVAHGSYQIETGVLHVEDRQGGADFESTEVLGTLVRIGLSDRLELRLGFDGFVSVPGSDGLGDASVGAKILLAEETEGSPQIAVLIESSVPVGDEALTSDDYAPAARLALAKDFGDSIGVGVNLGAEFPEDQEIAFYTVAIGVGLDDRNGVFFEVFGDSESSHSFDTGWTRLVRPNLQLDVAGGVGISDEAPDWFVGVGLSVRFPE